jgi:putative lipoic acid-binding regulatory protein
VQDDSALEFPCEFPIKAMGRADDNFDAVVVGIIRKHTPDFSDSTVKSRLSKGGNYVSITVTINARSREQLDNIYLDLTANDLVLVAL